MLGVVIVKNGFVKGLITGLSLVPILESLTELAQGWIEVAKIKPNEKVVKGNQELVKMQGGNEELSSCIGFSYDTKEYEDDD